MRQSNIAAFLKKLMLWQKLALFLKKIHFLVKLNVGFVFNLAAQSFVEIGSDDTKRSMTGISHIVFKDQQCDSKNNFSEENLRIAF